MLALLWGVSLPLQAAYNQDSGFLPKLDQLKLQISNQESELKTFEQKLENIDTILDHLRDQLRENAAQHKDLVKGTATTSDAKISQLESKTSSLTADLKQLHQHANETASTLANFKQKISELDQRLNNQSKNIENLQAGLQSILEALQIKTDTPQTTGRTYKVKSGDSLEKIAKMHNTTIAGIRELNGMANDKIIVGKTLKIPDAP